MKCKTKRSMTDWGLTYKPVIMPQKSTFTLFSKLPGLYRRPSVERFAIHPKRRTKDLGIVREMSPREV